MFSVKSAFPSSWFMAYNCGVEKLSPSILFKFIELMIHFSPFVEINMNYKSLNVIVQYKINYKVIKSPIFPATIQRTCP